MPADIGQLLGGQLFTFVAYIGPGADLALISSAIGLIATMGASFTFLVLYPFRLLWRRLTGIKSHKPEAQTRESDLTARSA